MTEQQTSAWVALRPRKPRPARRFRLDALAAGGPLPGHALAGAHGVLGPRLLPPEPEDRRAAIVAGLLSFLLHATGLAAIALITLLAPKRLIEDVIPVQILNDAPAPELPGSNEPLAPRALAPRQMISAAALAPMAALDLQAQHAPEAAAQVEAESVDLERMRETPTARPVAPRQVEAARLASAAESARPTESIAPVPRAVAVDVSDLSAPTVAVTGPRVLETTTAPIAAPREFRDFQSVSAREYSGTTSAAPAPLAGLGNDLDATGIDPSIDPELLSGGSGGEIGGTGSGNQAVPCLESAFVQRYQDRMEERARANWQVPAGTPTDAEAELAFKLDLSGMPRDLELRGAASDTLGESALSAMRLASPFAPLDDRTRCLTRYLLTMKLQVPE